MNTVRAGENPTAPEFRVLDSTARKVELSITYMVQNLDRPLPVSKLAEIANVSPSHYFALFKRQTGFAPIDFLIRLRMHKACELLTTTSLRVKEVAAALGYDDPFYFSRIFKVVNHVSPTEYRQHWEENTDNGSQQEDRSYFLSDAADHRCERRKANRERAEGTDTSGIGAEALSKRRVLEFVQECN